MPPDTRASAPEVPDDALMRRVTDGDVRAFGVLVERHRHGLMRLAFNVVRDRAEAEDIVQEVFERVWRKAAAWNPRDGASVFAWLARIAVNLSIDHVRRPRQEQLSETYDAPSSEPGSEQALFGKEIGRRITDALADLPDRQRMAFSLCQIDRMSNDQAAKSLGVTVGALELLLVRARKSVRRALADLVTEVG